MNMLKLVTLSNSGSYYGLTKNESVMRKKIEGFPVDKTVLIDIRDYERLHIEKFLEIGELQFLMHFDSVDQAEKHLHRQYYYVKKESADTFIIKHHVNDMRRDF